MRENLTSALLYLGGSVGPQLLIAGMIPGSIMKVAKYSMSVKTKKTAAAIERPSDAYSSKGGES
jgi:hypothetical protein